MPATSPDPEHFHRLARLFYSGNRTMTSYFWEARRLMGDEAGFDARASFVRAVSGQAPAGYERSVLAHGDLPAGFVAAVEQVQRGRADRRAAMLALRAALPQRRPLRAPGVAVEQRAVLGDGQFVWGDVIVAPERDDAVPCSPLVTALMQRADCALTLAELANALTPNAGSRDAVLASLCAAAELLYVDGLIAELS